MGKVTHGFRPKGLMMPEYKAWCSMRDRCLCVSFRDYHRYGGRGITICSRWDDFSNFLADMGRRPSSLYSIDRINNNGNYEPDNCRWATREQQQRNRRTTKLSESDVVEIRNSTDSQYSTARRFGIHQSTVSRLRSNEFWIIRPEVSSSLARTHGQPLVSRKPDETNNLYAQKASLSAHESIPTPSIG